MVLVLVVTAVITSIVVGFLIFYSVSSPLAKLRAATVEIGAGKVTMAAKAIPLDDDFNNYDWLIVSYFFMAGLVGPPAPFVRLGAAPRSLAFSLSGEWRKLNQLSRYNVERKTVVAQDIIGPFA
jgi:hypothetical protein